MKLILATGIFPPQLGGPALYCEHLAKEFSKRGIEIKVVTYGKNFKLPVGYKVVGVSRRWPIFLRQLIYLFQVCRQARGADSILAFDSLGAGLPAILAGKILNKKVIIRLGGDFLWEKFIESGRGLITIGDFYSQDFYRAFPMLKMLIAFTLKNSYKIIFTTDFQQRLFIQYYDLKETKSLVIRNVFNKEADSVGHYYSQGLKIILWAGRFIKLKNLDFLIKIFKKLLIKDSGLTLKLIGDGPEKNNIANFIRSEGLENKIIIRDKINEELLKKEIEQAYFCALPSLSEISPNFVLRCLSLNRPVLVTQETGIRDYFPELLYANPRDEYSFTRAGERLLDTKFYKEYERRIGDIKYKKSWSDLANEYLNMI